MLYLFNDKIYEKYDKNDKNDKIHDKIKFDRLRSILHIKTVNIKTSFDNLTERQHQQHVIKWAKEHSEEFPELNLLYHIPNERICSPKYGKLLKLAGVKAGVPDLCLPVARAGFHGLYLEMKAPEGRLSASQKEWLTLLTAQGYQTAACYSWVEAVEILQKYLTQPEAVMNRREC